MMYRLLFLAILLSSCTKKSDRPALSDTQAQHGYGLTRLGGSWNPPVCEEVYRGIYIDCRPANPEFIDEKYKLTADQLLVACRKYIDEMYPGKKPWIDTGRIPMGCHQMSGGPLVIDGVGN